MAWTVGAGVMSGRTPSLGDPWRAGPCLTHTHRNGHVRLQVSGSPSLRACFFSRSNNPLHLNRAFSFLKALFLLSHYLPLSSEQLCSKGEADGSPSTLQKPRPEQVGSRSRRPLLPGLQVTEGA